MLTISIVVHGNDAYLENCIQSITRQTTTPHHIVVTLNTGWTDTLRRISAAYPDIEFVVNAAPRGFAANHNAVLRRTQTDYAAILNDDILLHESALDQLVNYLSQHPNVALVGPRLLNPDGSIQISTYSDPQLLRSLYRVSGLAGLTSQRSLLRRLLLRIGGNRLKLESLNYNAEIRDVPIIKGAVMVVRRAAWEQAGLMDEATEFYGEEADWHWRMRQAGWQILFYPTARVTHFGLGQATLKLRGPLLVHDRKAILNYYIKHRPRWQAQTLRLFIVVSHTLRALLTLPFDRALTADIWRVVRMALGTHV
jgi:GT2 family glycosyltransferase